MKYTDLIKSNTKYREALAAAGERVANCAESAFGGANSVMVDMCESPIEAILGTHLMALSAFGLPTEFIVGPSSRSQYLTPAGDMVFVMAQQPIGKYRADFVVQLFLEGVLRSTVVVECDGHDFHERTKEQASRDRSRDRAMTADGYTVMRFTGAEIHKDAAACAAEVEGFLQEVIYPTKKAANG